MSDRNDTKRSPVCLAIIRTQNISVSHQNWNLLRQVKQSSVAGKAAANCLCWGHLHERSPWLRIYAPSLELAQATTAQICISSGMICRLNITIVKAFSHYPHWAFTTASIKVQNSLTKTDASSHSYTYEITLSLVTSLSMLTAGLQMTAGTKLMTKGKQAQDYS